MKYYILIVVLLFAVILLPFRLVYAILIILIKWSNTIIADFTQSMTDNDTNT
jgi:hypothetical protein